MILLTTDRLIIRSFHESDLDDLFCLLSNEEVMKYIEPPYNKKETKDFLYKYGLTKEPKIYAVTYQNKFIGYIIYHHYKKTRFINQKGFQSCRNMLFPAV